jgi:hypothetical protein
MLENMNLARESIRTDSSRNVAGIDGIWTQYSETKFNGIFHSLSCHIQTGTVRKLLENSDGFQLEKRLPEQRRIWTFSVGLLAQGSDIPM